MPGDGAGGTVEELAIDGGQPVRSTPFPSWPVWDEREEALLLEVLHSGRWGILDGDKVATFEKAFAAFQGARHALCVTSGTSALEIALRALGVGPGDEVITTPYSFVATPSAPFLVGARPVFVDIDPETYLIDAARIESAVTERTRAILPVHIGGCPCDMDAILDIAERHDLQVVEDACQAWGASWRGRPLGAIGDLGCFSFQASKNINAGEGGAILTNDPELAERCWSLHNVGRVRDGAWYQHEFLGWNYRMTEWQGAVLLAQLERLPAHIERRTDNAAYLSSRLHAVAGITPVKVDERVTQHAWHLYIATYDPAAFGGRPCREFISMLNAEGVPCSAGYVPLNLAPAVRRALGEQQGTSRPWAACEGPPPSLGACPVAEDLCQRTIWFGQRLLLGDHSEVDDIVAAIQKIQRVVGRSDQPPT